MSAAVGAAIERQRRLMVQALRTAGALAPETAVAPAGLGNFHFHVLARAQRRGVVKTLADGRVWLDEAAWAADRRRRRTLAVAMLGIAVVVIAVSAAIGSGALALL